MIYQIRNKGGHKLAECTLADEVLHFLRERPAQHYEIWILSDDPPSDLKGIYPAPEFCHKATQKPENPAGRTIYT